MFEFKFFSPAALFSLGSPSLAGCTKRGLLLAACSARACTEHAHVSPRVTWPMHRARGTGHGGSETKKKTAVFSHPIHLCSLKNQQKTFRQLDVAPETEAAWTRELLRTKGIMRFNYSKSNVHPPDESRHGRGTTGRRRRTAPTLHSLSLPRSFTWDAGWTRALGEGGKVGERLIQTANYFQNARPPDEGRHGRGTSGRRRRAAPRLLSIHRSLASGAG